ncbi:hypothetical protein J6TS7_20850 [Paenibacillus dendritiformis]|uniref:CpaF family protein n=1 Tax=Paenibacillus TaxID=44249 RepID=UPI001B278072|nr:ATPase, T2SS/T4P/T4SS family [Paenibacillus dendritiformis]GIO78475.1 hypothetical protein J6TS7_20850 [Paenibacillus dendritiformis]
MFGRKKKSEDTLERPKLSYSVYSPYGIDVSHISIELAKATNDKSIILEFPCQGIPRLSNHFPELDFTKSKSMGKLMLDFERKDVVSYENYIQKLNGFDSILINPKESPDLPVLLKMSSTRSLIELPLKLKQSLLQYYQSIIYSLQGQMINPMTFYSLRSSDIIVLYFEKLTEMAWTYLTYQKLVENYSVPRERIFLLSPVKNIELPVPVYQNIHEVLQQGITEVESIEGISAKKEYTEHQGFINPVEHIPSKVLSTIDQAQLSISDSEKMQKLLTKVRLFLRDRYNDEFVQALHDESARKKVCYYIADFVREQKDFIFQTSLDQIITLLQTEITEMGVLQEPLDEKSITSIEVNSPSETIVEKNGVPEHDERIRFQDNDHMHSIISKMLMPIGKTLSANEPVIDANYRGFRICVTLERSKGGVSANTPTISIRKFPPDVYSDEDCVAYGNLSEEMVEFLQDIYPCGPTTLICGGTNSGKTSQLIRIPLYLPEITKILTIEDSEEMMLKQKIAYQNYPNIVSLIVKDHENERKRYDIGKLVKTTLRQNPDWIFIGEVRDSHATTQALEAANTGHAVAMTIHANSAAMGAVRMMQLAGNNEIAAAQVGSTVDLIIHQANDHGRRRIMEISELICFKDGRTPELNPIFVYDSIAGMHVFKNKIKKMRPKLIQQRAPQEVIERWCEK